MKYVGLRYVPKMDGEHDSTKEYEPLTIVTNHGNSYTSKKFVPNGIELTNEDYWVQTGNYNGSITLIGDKIKEINNTLGENASTLATLLRNKVDYLNVKDFGAKADGITNDTNAIQLAIDTCVSQGGGIVYIPTGRYLIDTLILKSNVNLLGDGSAETILESNGSSKMITTPHDQRRFSIKRMMLDGKQKAEYGIYLKNDTSVNADTISTIEDVRAGYVTKNGVYLGTYIREIRLTNMEILGCGESGLNVNACSDSCFQFVTSRSNKGPGFEINGPDNRLVSCKAYCNGSAATPAVGFDVSKYRNIFSSCSSQQNTGHGVFVHNARDIRFTDLMADCNGNLIGPAPSVPTKAGLKAYKCKYLKIDGFFTDFFKHSVGQSQKSGVVLEDCQYYSVDMTASDIPEDFTADELCTNGTAIVNGVKKMATVEDMRGSVLGNTKGIVINGKTITYSDRKPVSTKDTVPGDICFNTNPNVGTCTGWICIGEGFSAVWKEFGTLN